MTYIRSVWTLSRRSRSPRSTWVPTPCIRRRPPAITRFIDPGPDLTVAFTRAVLGAVAGWLLRGQITGIYAALTVGASAPAVLATLGKATTPAGALGRGHGANVARVPEREPGQPPEVQPEAAE